MSCLSSVSVVVFVFVRNKMKIVKVDPNNEILLTISKHDFVFNTSISLNGISWINWINCSIALAGIEIIGQHIKAHLHCSAKYRKSKLKNHKVTGLDEDQQPAVVTFFTIRTTLACFACTHLCCTHVFQFHFHQPLTLDVVQTRQKSGSCWRRYCSAEESGLCVKC